MSRFNTSGRLVPVTTAATVAAFALSVAATPAGTAAAGPDAAATAAQSEQGFEPAAFVNPPKDSRPSVYWYWTGTVTADVVDAQMAELRDKGIHEAVLFPYGGPGMKPALHRGVVRHRRARPA